MPARMWTGVNVGAPVNPRMTMPTKPLSPSCAVWKPDAVRTLIAARLDMLSGAAVFANAILASRAVMYSLSGGYFASCAFVAVAPKPASSTHNTYRYLFIFTWILLLKLFGFLINCAVACAD